MVPITDVESQHLTISFIILIAPFFVDRYLDESRASFLHQDTSDTTFSEKWVLGGFLYNTIVVIHIG